MRNSSDSSELTATMKTKDIPDKIVDDIVTFLTRVGALGPIPDNSKSKDFYSDIVRGLLLEPIIVQRGRVTCLISVKPAVVNFFSTLHGGVVAAIAETVSIACARTIVAEDKHLFLGELSISYLSSAPLNAEVIVESSVVRSGRNLTVVALEFKAKKTGRLTYTARSTFYNMPVSKL